ncbi:uncharacterized protein N7500_000364 [Penicillium coprophilum]|uniref:uncharacterized protein n=1 Tax=Penicillium coprophilum TaxID=36646 RepID=UPI002390E164|nr:uncharacterized protein N7500_000364 [Penicillium coprophilum]KAJ5177665.1 hypothetical protein N7500_000364 [Penicillium coprophilum]
MAKQEQNESPPNYEEAVMTPPRYGSLPSTMNVHGQWTKWKSLNLCGASAKDRLCLIEMQTGYSGKPPLGMRTGFLLRNGMSTKNPLLAAAGDESQGLHAFNPDGIIFCHHLIQTPKVMRAEPGTNNDIAFHFSIEIGEKQQRQEFAWRRAKKGDDGVKKNGFKLVLLSSGQQASRPSASSSIQKPASSLPSSRGKDGENVAFLEWAMAFPSMTHAFTLELVDGQSEMLGARWTLMVVVTAIRLYTLHVKGKTSKFVVNMGKKDSK